MDPKRFEQYSLRKQISLIRKLGVKLAVRHYDQHKVYLYDLDKMIVEVWYAKRLLRKRAVRVEVSLVADQLLEPYLEIIQLNLNE